MLSQGAELSEKRRQRYEVLWQIYEQQQYMYENNVHTVPNRIVSISQPYIRPIVRGKASAPVEFGAKLDISLSGSSLGRPKKDAVVDRKSEYVDSADRIEVERSFSYSSS